MAKNDPEVDRAYRLRTQYKMTVEEYDALEKKQGTSGTPTLEDFSESPGQGGVDSVGMLVELDDRERTGRCPSALDTHPPPAWLSLPCTGSSPLSQSADPRS